MSQFFVYPPSGSSGGGSSSFSGPTGDPVPSQAAYVAGIDDSGNLQGLHVDPQGNLQVDVLSSALPAGAATETTLSAINVKTPALVSGRVPVDVQASVLPTGAATAAAQATGNASLASIDAGIPAALGQGTMAQSMPVVIASNQTAIPVSMATAPLPTGAATAANQVLGNTSLSNIESSAANIDTSTANLSGAVVPYSTAVPANALQLGGGDGALLQPIGAELNDDMSFWHLRTADKNSDAISDALTTRLSGSLVPAAYDEVALTYVVSGPGIGQIDTAVYKLLGSTIKTLTMSYDGSDRLSGVVAT